jgi:AraC family transcriptional regulator
MHCVERGTYYGVRHNQTDDGVFDYLAGVEVEELTNTPNAFSVLRLAAHRYAAFPHNGGVSTVSDTLATIHAEWLPVLGYEAAVAPTFERYDADFDRSSGKGGCEIWVPLKVGNGPQPH